MTTATISEKGQVTIPKPLRDAFGITLDGPRRERLWERAVEQHEAFVGYSSASAESTNASI